MPVRMTHEKYGSRDVDESQVAAYERTRWTKADEAPAAAAEETVDEVLARVGDDPEAAAAALEAEQARSKPRTTLVTALQRIATPTGQEA